VFRFASATKTGRFVWEQGNDPAAAPKSAAAALAGEGLPKTVSDVSYLQGSTDCRWRQVSFLLKAAARDVKGKRGLAMGQMIKKDGETASTNVYRVCGGANRWHVYQDPEAIPVASFEDKAAALNYAMCLARGRVAWHLLLRQQGTSVEQAPRANSSARH
jgi:hypothetical protein